MEIDWWTLALQTINFLVVVWLLSRFLYRPVRRMIEERETADRKLAEEAQSKAEEAERTKAEYEEKLAAQAEKRRKDDAEFHARLERERKEILDKARSEAEETRAEAREKAGAEHDKAIAALKDEIAGLAGDLAAKALEDGAILTDQGAQSAVASHLDDLGAADLSELKKDLSDENAVLHLATARELSEPETDAWRELLSRRLGNGIRIAFDTDNALIGGVELRFPHATLSMSVADRLRRARETLERTANDDQ